MRNHSLAVSFPLVLLLGSVLIMGCDRVSTPSGQVAVASTDTPTPTVNQTSKAIATDGKQKSAHAVTAYEIKNTRSKLFFDPDKWQQEGPETDGRVEFIHKTGDGYASIISERPQMSFKALREAALENAKKVSTDARIVAEEKRVVNGREVLRLEMKATIQDIPFAYVGYYFTGKEGTVQVLTFTTENLLNDYRPDFEEFLNGFTVKG